MVEGRQFAVYTDHKPLTLVMPTATSRTPRQERHLSFISEFTTDIRHVKGGENQVADHLSRPIMAALLPAVDLELIAFSQERDPETKERLKTAYAKTQAERCAELLAINSLGDRSPEHLLSYMPVSYTHLTLPTICSV